MAIVPVGGLVDTFGSVSAYWNASYGGATALGGYGHIPCAHVGGSPSYAALRSTFPAAGDTWTMLSTALYLEAVTMPVAGSATVCYCQLAITSATSGTYLSILYDAVGGNISCGSYTGFSDAGLVVFPYVPASHRWWRIRSGLGALYWETSPDGIVWTARRSMGVQPSWIATDAVGVQLDSVRNGGADDYARFDNVNIFDVPLCGGSAITVTVSGSVAAVTLSGAAVVA